MAKNRQSITVAVVEDDERLRHSLEQILRRDSRCEFVGAYSSAEDALKQLPLTPASVVIMDINLPGMSGVECVRRLSELLPGVKTLMLTVFNDSFTIFEALRAGAGGYLHKPVRAAQLLSAVLDLEDDGAPMTGSIARLVVQSFKGQTQPEASAEELTPRESQVLDHLAQGYLYKEIAAKMDVTYATIRTHVEHIYAKLHVQSRSQAVAATYRLKSHTAGSPPKK